MPNTAPNDKLKDTNPTALVAGGAGFLGSHLVETLLSQNFKVLCIDNFSTGSRENLKQVLTSPSLTILEADINNPNLSLPEGVKIDYCFHLASSENYESENLSLDTLLVNSLGTKQLLELSREHKAKFILISAADLYGGAISSSSLRYYFGKTPQQEAVLTSHEAKRFSEALAFEYYKKYKLDLTIVRLKDVYGPRMNLSQPDSIAQLLQQALSRKSLIVEGDGLDVINPTYVSDVIFGLIKASVGDFSGEIFILVNPDKVTVESFAQTVKLVAGPLELEHKKNQETTEFNSQHFDLENTISKLNWKPRVTLAEGISSVIHQVKMAQESTVVEATQIRVLEEKTSTNLQTQAVVTKKSSQTAKRLRLAIFIGSAALLGVTLVYPLVSFALNSYQGRGNLKDAYQALLSEENERAVGQASDSQKNFDRASKSLNNLDWLAKIVGLDDFSTNKGNLLEASSFLSQSIRSSARANQILLVGASNQSLTSTEAARVLNLSLDNLYAAIDTIETTKLIIAQVPENSGGLLLPTKAFVNQTNTSLSTQVNELTVTVEDNLAKGP